MKDANHCLRDLRVVAKWPHFLGPLGIERDHEGLKCIEIITTQA